MCVYVCVCRYGYFGKDKPEVVRLLLCNLSGCLTDGQIYMSADGLEMVSLNTRDSLGIRMLQKEGVEVGGGVCSHPSHIITAFLRKEFGL